MSKSLNILVKNIERFAQGTNFFQISKASNVPSSTFSRILNKQSSPSLETLDKIAEALNVDTYELIQEDSKDNSSIPADIHLMLRDQPEAVYDTIRTILKTYQSVKKENKKSN